MPKATQTIRVRPIDGETMRFYVESWSHPQRPHIVDLLAGNGASECSCTDWMTRRNIALRNGGKPGSSETMCRHVKAARNYFLNRLLRQMASDHAHAS